MRLSSPSPDPQLLELPRNQALPVAIRGWASRAGMQDATDLQGAFRKEVFRPFGGKIPDSDQPFGLKGRDDGSQMAVADGEEGRLFGGP